VNVKQQASDRLTQIQARLYQLGQEEKALTEEARTLAGFLNLSQKEEEERCRLEGEAKEDLG
jgi:hypothetical protein